ncbi:MAG TPA: Ig-like domain-containing protein, partial [Pseudoneobacillus sp.]|nr:Ig-like domain-containing protein [Pseudoneobacillus sp.]
MKKNKKNRLYKSISAITASSVVISALPPGAFALTTTGATPGAWPTNSTTYKYTPYTYSDGLTMFDPAGEPGISPDDVDFTSGPDKGAGNLPSYYVATDGTNMFFRVRIKGDPNDRKGGFLSSVWLVQLGVNGEHKATIGVNGKPTDEDYIYIADANGENIKYIYKTQAGTSQVQGTRIVNAENGQYFLDFQVPISELNSYGITSTTAVQLHFATSKAANLSVVNKDGKDSPPFAGKAFIKPSLIGNALTPTISIDEGDSYNYSANNKATITGTTINAPTGSTVSVEINNQVKTTTVNASGGWSIPLSQFTNLNGTYIARATITDSLGNKGNDEQDVTVTATDGTNITIDGGLVAMITDSTPTISGTTTASNGSKVNLVIKDKNGSQVFTSQVNVSGNGSGSTRAWTVDVTSVLKEDNSPYIVEATLNGTTVTQLLSYGSTNVDIQTISGAIPTVSGVAEPGVTVQISVGGVSRGTVTSDITTGQWTYTLEKPLPTGTHTFEAKAIDSVGNTATDTMSYTVNTVSISIDNGDAVTTTDNQPTIKGRTNAPDGSKVTVKIGSETYTDMATVTGGKWLFEYPQDKTLSDGPYTVNASVSGATDNQVLTIDRTTMVTIDSPLYLSQTKEVRPEIKGKSEGNATIILYIDGELDGIVTADHAGNWSYTPQRDLTEDRHTVRANASDVNGNEATATNEFTITSNEAPTATVNITGIAHVGEVLTGAYTYADTELDIQGTSRLQWYRGTKADGSDKVAIQGANGNQYTLQEDDVNYYFFFEVKPVAQTGTLEGAPEVSEPSAKVNAAPKANNVGISGLAKVGQQVSGHYTYTDVNGDEEGSSIFKWYRGSKVDGSDKELIDGASGKTYTLISSDVDQYIFFEVTPVASTGKLIGTSVLSLPSSLVEEGTVIENRAPVASNVTISGIAKLGQELEGSYVYSDAENDPQGTSQGQWFRATTQDGEDKVAILGATASTYTLTNDDIGKYLIFGVTPVASIGESTGTLVMSAPTSQVQDNESPTATGVTISGTAKEGQQLTGLYSYRDTESDTEDTSLFQWYRGRNADGSDKVLIENATDNTYSLTAEDVGYYMFFKVTPVASTGTFTGDSNISQPSALVVAETLNAAPTASNVGINGTAKVGENLTGLYDYTDIDMDLKGESLFQWYRATKSDGSDQVAIS